MHSWKLQQVILNTSVRQHLYVYGPDAHILTSEKTVPIPLVYTRPQIFKYLPRWVCRVGAQSLRGCFYISDIILTMTEIGFASDDGAVLLTRDSQTSCKVHLFGK